VIKMIPEYLNKVMSDKKAIEISDILEACRPTHPQRLWLVGFLKFAGYQMDEVLDIIREHCHWSDYNTQITAYQVGTIFRHRPQRTQNHSALRPRKWNLSPLEVLRIQYQKSVSLSKILCEEHKQMPFPHPERLACMDLNPSAGFLRK
jgi:hypothetical protein